jgi:hypothetical protein
VGGCNKKHYILEEGTEMFSCFAGSQAVPIPPPSRGTFERESKELGCEEAKGLNHGNLNRVGPLKDLTDAN